MKFNLALLGFRIGERRRELKITQDVLAEKAGVSCKHISAIETGKTRPRIETLFLIAEALNVTTDYFTVGVIKKTRTQEIEDMLRMCSDEDVDTIYEIVKVFSDKSTRKI